MRLVAYFHPFYNFSHFVHREPQCPLGSRFRGGGAYPYHLGSTVVRRVFGSSDGLKLGHRLAVQRGQTVIGHRVTNGRTKTTDVVYRRSAGGGRRYNSTREPGRRGSACGWRLGSGLPGMGWVR